MTPSIGAWHDFVTDPLSDAAKWVGGAFSDIFEKIPGSKWVGKWAEDLYNGPLRDFAKSDIGKFTLRAMAASVSTGAMALGWIASTAVGAPALGIIGNAMAFTAAAVPGLLRGERFDQALINEWGWRIQQAVEIVPARLGLNFDEWVAKYGNQALDQIRQIAQDYSKQFKVAVEAIRQQAFAAMPPELKLGTQEAADYLPVLFRKVDPIALGQKLGIRTDAVEMAKGALLKEIPDLSKYDLLSGKPLVQYSDQANILSSTSQAAQAAQLNRPGISTQVSSLLKARTMTTPYVQSSSSTSVSQQIQKGSRAVQAAQAPSLQMMQDTFVMSTKEDAESFWEKHKLWILGGAGVLTLGGILYWTKKR